MTLTKEMSDTLKDFFPVNAHEFLKGACYITEEQITDRLDEVDPSWTFEKQSIIQRDKRIIATYRLTVGGAYRDGVGMETIQYGKGQDGSKPTDYEVNEAEKSAATDALKRAARLFGIGRYILTMGNAVSNYETLKTWLAAQRNVNPQTGEIKLVQNGTQKPQEAVLSELQQSTHDLTSQPEAPVKSPSERLGTQNGQTIAPRPSGFPMGDFKTRCLKEIYANNAIHMNKSLKKLIDAGVLNYDTMTIAEAFEVVRTRKEVEIPA
jgi:hypothetical protein